MTGTAGPPEDYGTLSVGFTKFTDDTGLDWYMVVVANEHGDCPFAVLPGNPVGKLIADAVCEQLLGQFEVLGLEAERGEVQSP